LRPCSADEQPGDNEVLPAASEARRLAVAAELCYDRTQQPVVTPALRRRCQLRH